MATDPLDFLDQPYESDETSEDTLGFLDEDFSRGRSLASAFPKGAIRTGRKFNPLQPGSPIPNKLAERMLQKFLPTREEAPEEILETAGELAPFVAMGPEGLISKGAQVATGALGKQIAKELSLPEWAQEIIGAGSMGIPGASKSLLSKGMKVSPKQEAVYNFLKSKGMTDKQITPIIQNPKKTSWFSKGAFKYEKESPFIQGIEKKNREIYNGIREQGKKSGYLEGEALKDFEKDFYKEFDDLSELNRGRIKAAEETLFKKPITYADLLDFKIHANELIKDTEGGKAAIGVLKGPVKRAQAKLSAPLFKEQELADKAYKGMKNFTKKMTTKNWEGVTKLGTAGKVLMGAVLLNPAMMGIGLKTAAAVAAGRYALRQMLVNPRLQNMHKKIQEALLQNKTKQALQLSELFKKELEKRLPSVKDEEED